MEIAITLANRELNPAVVNFFQYENQTVTLNFTLDSYMYGEVDLRNYKAYGVTSQNGLIDMTELVMNYDSAEDKLVLSWEVQEYSLRQEGAITYQIVFKENADDGENTAVFYSYKGIMINRGSLDGDNHITANYPTILKQWLDKIEELAGTLEAGIIYIPYGETIPVSERLPGRLYFQYTDSSNIGGRFEDHEGFKLKLNDYLPLTGDQTVDGVKTFTSSPKVPNITNITDDSQKTANTNFVQNVANKTVQQINALNESVSKQISDLDESVVKSVNGLNPDDNGDVTVSTIKAKGTDSYSQVRGADTVSNGARLNLFGKDYADNPGDFSLIANNGTNSSSLIGKPNGELSWGGEPIVTCSTAGTILNKGTTIIRQNATNSYTQIFGGDTYLNGAYVRLNGKGESSGGGFVLSTGDGSANKSLIGKPDGTLTWVGEKLATESRISSIMNTLYPVGSLYLTVNSTCPLATLISGSTWELVSQDRVLQGAGTRGSAGGTLEAGLPNITGSITPKAANNDGYNTTNDNSGTGALSVTNAGFNARTAGLTSAQYNVGTIGFNASRSNSIYGASNTVQPPAYLINVFKRTK